MEVTLIRSVSGETQNSSGNLDLLPEIGRQGIFSGKYDIDLGYCRKKKNKFDKNVTEKNRKDVSNFREDLKLNVVLFKQRLLVLSSCVLNTD